MKRLHRDDLYTWSTFDTRRDVDFNGFAWIRPGGNVLVDPVPMIAHDEKQLKELGGASWIVVTNSDHARAAEALAKAFGAKICGPRAEKSAFPIRCDRWLADGDEVVPRLVARELDGSKTPGELALVLDGATYIFGDLVRAHRAASLVLLPDDKLKDRAAALASVRRVVSHDAPVDAVLVGDGWCAFGESRDLLDALLAEEEDAGAAPAHAADSGQYRIPASRSSIPAARAAACSFCRASAAERHLVAGAAPLHADAAICAVCAARLAPGAARATCDFCAQEADETARDQHVTICRECLDLARAVFDDA